MPSLSNIFKWLWNTLVDFFSYVICHVLDFLAAILLLVSQFVLGLLPSVEVPSWLSSAGASNAQLQFLAFYFPVAWIFWFTVLVVSVETWYSIVVPVYRAIMDLF